MKTVIEQFDKIFNSSMDKRTAIEEELDFHKNLYALLSQLIGEKNIGILFKEQKELTVGDYKLVFNHRLLGEWVDVIEAVPAYVGSDHGYSNTESVTDPRWYYEMGGTTTVCVPNEQVRQEILQLLRKQIKK